MCVKGSTPTRLPETGFLLGCFPCVSPERPLAKRLQLGSFSLTLPTFPVLDKIAAGCWVQEYGWDVEMLFGYSASVLIHLPALHCVSQELTQQTPRIAALPSEKNPGLCY